MKIQEVRCVPGTDRELPVAFCDPVGYTLSPGGKKVQLPEPGAWETAGRCHLRPAGSKATPQRPAE